MTAHVTRFPACPVFKLSEWPPIPKSSGSSWITRDLPITFAFVPLSFTRSSSITNLATPFESNLILPRSPTCLSLDPGPPCFFPYGLKWAHAPIHASERSPASWMWIPCILFLNFVDFNIPLITTLLPLSRNSTSPLMCGWLKKSWLQSFDIHWDFISSKSIFSIM